MSKRKVDTGPTKRQILRWHENDGAAGTMGYIILLIEMKAPDGTMLGDDIPGSSFKRCFCGQCASPIRAPLIPAQIRFRERVKEFLKKKFEKMKPGTFADVPILPAELLSIGFITRNLLCEKCEPVTAPWRHYAMKPQHIQEKIAALILDESNK